MLKRIFNEWPMWLTALLGVALCSTPSMAAEFTADINQRLHGTALTGKIFVKGEKYRIEQQDAEGRQMFIIVDQKANLTIVVDPAEKNYMDTPSNGMLSLMNDPFQSSRYMEAKFKKKPLSDEMVSGYDCGKFKLETDEQELMTVWKAKKLGFALKITLPDKKQSFVQLKNIKEGPVDEVRFQVPAGYTRKEDPKKKRDKEEAALPVVTTTIRGEAPWARRIGQGGEIRVKVDPGKSVRFRFENLIKDESVFTIKAFRNGRPIKMDIKETYSLRGKGRRQEPLLGLQNKADEIAIRVEKGKIIAKVIVKESSFAKDKIDTFFIMTGLQDSQRGVYLDTKRQLRLIITSDSQDGPESKVTVKFYKGDYKDKIDEVKVVLINGQSKTWACPPEKGIKTIEIAVAKSGGVKVRIEQPAPQKAVKPKPAAKVVRTTPSKQAKETKAQAAQSRPGGPRLSKEQAKKFIKAINVNDITAVESDLDKGIDVNSMLYGGTLLMKAANLSTADMVKMLISRGANLNFRTSRGEDALSVAMSNSRHWQQVILTLVESGITIDEKTPIWKVAFKTKKGKLLPEAKKILELLFAKGASPDCHTSRKESTVIMYYAKKGWLDPLKFFLNHKADVNARTIDGQTALSMALTKPRRPENSAQKKERQAVVELLRSKGAK
ncbi:MAG: DUF4412 domain-containing protein [Desulfobacteraceae bacterium]|nr:MAG: DUF4412 domain-containing protein [Desulfobacteraceae bacterium]